MLLCPLFFQVMLSHHLFQDFSLLATCPTHIYTTSLLPQRQSHTKNIYTEDITYVFIWHSRFYLYDMQERAKLNCGDRNQKLWWLRGGRGLSDWKGHVRTSVMTMFLSVLGSGCIRVCPGQNTANVQLRSVYFITYKSDTNLKKRLC